MKLLLSPHHDDAELFASYVLLRHRPFVAVCFAGSPRYGDPATRRQETSEAMRILGCDWGKLPEGDLRSELACFAPTHVWAPLPEPWGNCAHNLVGGLAAELWPDRVTFYTTYTTAGRTVIGDPVPVEPGWPDLKRVALACYRSQIEHPSTRPHFERPLDEYLTDAGAIVKPVPAQASA